MKYTGPRDRLEAAQSPKTSREDLTELAVCEYEFVKAAVAANINTPSETLEQLLPGGLHEKEDCEIVLGLLKNPSLPEKLFVEIAHLLESVAGTISPRDYCQNEVLKELARARTAPLDALMPLANPSLFHQHTRGRIANCQTRIELLRVLVNDPSEKISRMATKALKENLH